MSLLKMKGEISLASISKYIEVIFLLKNKIIKISLTAKIIAWGKGDRDRLLLPGGTLT